MLLFGASLDIFGIHKENPVKIPKTAPIERT
jgi:hypothetical protein